jgi:hypothetical protein
VAVRTDHRVTASADTFTAAKLADHVPKNAWARMRTGHGLNGDRHYDWALLDVIAENTPTEHAVDHSHLVIRRHRYTGELSFYRCHSATPVALATLVDAICCRWKIEEDFQLGKSACGLGQGQTTRWNSWMRWTLISMLAAAVLAVTRLRATAQAPRGRLVPASARELLRLPRSTVLPSPRRDRDHLLHWSAWRRRPPAPRGRSTPPLEQRHRGRDDMTRPTWSRTTAAVSVPSVVVQGEFASPASAMMPVGVGLVMSSPA